MSDLVRATTVPSQGADTVRVQRYAPHACWQPRLSAWDSRVPVCVAGVWCVAVYPCVLLVCGVWLRTRVCCWCVVCVAVWCSLSSFLREHVWVAGGGGVAGLKSG